MVVTLDRGPSPRIDTLAPPEVREGNPEEQYGAIDREIQRLSGIYNNPNLSREELENLKLQFGVIKPEQQKPVVNPQQQSEIDAINKEIKRRSGIISGGQQLAIRELEKRKAEILGTANTPQDEYESTRQSDASLRKAIENKMFELGKQQENIKNIAVDQRLNKVRSRESELRSNLLSTQATANQQLDLRLNQELEEAGLHAGEARAMTGAALADRGLSRSTAGSQALGEIYQSELGEKGRLRSQVEEQKGKIKGAIDDTFKNIENRRQQLEINRDLAALKSFDDLGFDVDTQKIKFAFENEINDMQLDTNEKSFYYGMAGSLLGNVAKLFALA